MQLTLYGGIGDFKGKRGHCLCPDLSNRSDPSDLSDPLFVVCLERGRVFAWKKREEAIQ
jgi:hypothetical protein